MGLRARQVLGSVEVPIAMPLILTGVRTAAIQIVSTATIAAYVGLGGLGRYIFDGLARQEYPTVIGGAILVVAARAAHRGRASSVPSAFWCPPACGATDLLKSDVDTDPPRRTMFRTYPRRRGRVDRRWPCCPPVADEKPVTATVTRHGIVVGSANFPENHLLAEIYAQALEAKDIKVDRKFNIGSREVIYKQIESGGLSVLPEYNGALLAYLDKTNESTSTEEVNTALKAKLPKTLEVLDSSKAEDKDPST